MKRSFVWTPLRLAIGFAPLRWANSLPDGAVSIATVGSSCPATIKASQMSNIHDHVRGSVHRKGFVKNMLFILIAFSAGWHRGVANRYWNVTGQPKDRIQESFNFPTLVQKNAGAGSFSNLCVYSFYSLKPCCPPLEQMHPRPGGTVYSLYGIPLPDPGCFRSHMCIRSR